MASSDSDDDYSDDDEQDDSECSFYDNEDGDDDDDDDDDDDEEEDDDNMEGEIGASDDDEDGSDSEYFLNDDDDDYDDDEEEEEEDDDAEEEEEEGHGFEEDGINREIDAGDIQGLPALEHAPMEPDEISQSTDGPFSRQSTPDVSSNSRAVDMGADSRPKEIPNPDALADTDLHVEAKDESVPPPLISSLPGEMDKMKIYDPSEPSADFPANGSIDNGRGVDNKGQ